MRGEEVRWPDAGEMRLDGPSPPRTLPSREMDSVRGQPGGGTLPPPQTLPSCEMVEICVLEGTPQTLPPCEMEVMAPALAP